MTFINLFYKLQSENGDIPLEVGGFSLEKDKK